MRNMNSWSCRALFALSVAASATYVLAPVWVGSPGSALPVVHAQAPAATNCPTVSTKTPTPTNDPTATGTATPTGSASASPGGSPSATPPGGGGSGGTGGGPQTGGNTPTPTPPPYQNPTPEPTACFPCYEPDIKQVPCPGQIGANICLFGQPPPAQSQACVACANVMTDPCGCNTLVLPCQQLGYSGGGF
jgi:hypothetical protein